MIKYICTICGTEPEAATGCRICTRCETPMQGLHCGGKLRTMPEIYRFHETRPFIHLMPGARFVPASEPEIGDRIFARFTQL